MEHPGWQLDGPDWDYGEERDGDMQHSLQIANCPDASYKKLDFLEDPDGRYWVGFDLYEKDVDFDTCGSVAYVCGGSFRVPIEKAGKKENA
ncbi:unnamed protein product [Cylindrotheca closterium]|uniref:Uncharacterized protein n=1 Tax=Cylindrotheca closterium TaxID=2856 RepID=A0AAD2PWU5_9STRA|nr:unnamed protein product [Cylindrotheca closterium]